MRLAGVFAHLFPYSLYVELKGLLKAISIPSRKRTTKSKNELVSRDWNLWPEPREKRIMDSEGRQERKKDQGDGREVKRQRL